MLAYRLLYACSWVAHGLLMGLSWDAHGLLYANPISKAMNLP